MTCGDILRIIIALFIPPLGVFTQVGLTQPCWINLVIYLFVVVGLGFSMLFGMWPAAVIHALFVILTRKKSRFSNLTLNRFLLRLNLLLDLLVHLPAPVLAPGSYPLR